MSGILGFWNLDGSPAMRTILSRMAQATPHRSVDGTEVIVNGPFAMAVQALYVSTESEGEQQPHVDRSGSLFAFDGTLFNREELADAFAWEPSRAKATSDVAYLAEAHR